VVFENFHASRLRTIGLHIPKKNYLFIYLYFSTIMIITSGSEYPRHNVNQNDLVFGKHWRQRRQRIYWYISFR